MKVLETLAILAFGAVVAFAATNFVREVWAHNSPVVQALTVK